VSTRSVTGEMARAVAALLGGHAYRVTLPPGRDAAVFKVSGLPGDPDVEVAVEHSGQAACQYVGRSAAEAAEVIARLPQTGAAGSDTLTATWGGIEIEIEWHYQPPAGQPASPDQVAAALLAHLAVLGGCHDRKDGPT